MLSPSKRKHLQILKSIIQINYNLYYFLHIHTLHFATIIIDTIYDLKSEIDLDSLCELCDFINQYLWLWRSANISSQQFLLNIFTSEAKLLKHPFERYKTRTFKDTTHKCRSTPIYHHVQRLAFVWNCSVIHPGDIGMVWYGIIVLAYFKFYRKRDKNLVMMRTPSIVILRLYVTLFRASLYDLGLSKYYYVRIILAVFACIWQLHHIIN